VKNLSQESDSLGSNHFSSKTRGGLRNNKCLVVQMAERFYGGGYWVTQIECRWDEYVNREGGGGRIKKGEGQQNQWHEYRWKVRGEGGKRRGKVKRGVDPTTGVVCFYLEGGRVSDSF